MKTTYSWIVTAVLVVVGISIVVSGSAAAQSADIVVSTDGNEDYSSIQAAIDNAEQNDRIEVKPGAYPESVDINKNVELVASNGATIAPPSSAVSAVAIENGAEPQIENITITGENRIGLDARSTTADWTVTSLNISGFDFGIATFRSQSDWRVEDTIIKNIKTRGISADESEGNWTINSTIIRNVAGIGVDAYEAESGVIKNTKIVNITQNDGDNGDGILLDATAGDWILNNITVAGTSEYGIDIDGSEGDVLITGSTIRNTGPGESKHGVQIEDATSDWTIQDTTIENISGEGIDAYNQPESSQATIRNLTVADTQNHGLNFYDSNGDWEVIDSHISDSENKGIEAGDTSGDWNISSTTVEMTNRVLIEASGATGNWEIHESKLSTGGQALNATEAVEGNASYNYWGVADGPSGDFSGSGGAATGNVIVTPYYTDSSLTTLSSEQDSEDNGDNEDSTNGFVDIDASDLAGSGTAADPYVITNASELQAMEDDLEAHYALGSDIDASNTAQWNNGKGFDPIGYGEDGYGLFGSFDGNGHTITSLTIDRPNEDDVGLFRASRVGALSDVGLLNVNVRGGVSTGGLVGYHNRGTIRNVTITGTIEGTDEVGGLAGSNFLATIRNVRINATVRGDDEVSGVTPLNRDSIIRNVSVRGEIDSQEAAGGIVYNNEGNIRHVYSVAHISGDYSAGIAANNAGNISSSFSTEKVTRNNQDNGVIENSYWDNSGQETSEGYAIALTTSQMVGEAARSNMSELLFGAVWEVQTDDYPALINNPNHRAGSSGSGDGTSGPADVTGNGVAPTDTNGDGLFEDINGDGSVGFSDLTALYRAFNSGAIDATNSQFFNFNGDDEGEVDFADITALYSEHIQQGG